ncbi:MerR family transcriptional regulator [Prauserella sp. PE36]|uniref:MerR family transcriptional regulator n=1 Tax=Prauserella sp. PE36 TaxID=1504709 RepID=UPI001F16DEAF|nr:MerR family transcriptional regulator [Prauserella sp. PE36]
MRDPVPSPSAEPTLPVAAVARRLGVAPSTLRTWDRRYGLGPSRHTGGRHRRYGPSDVVRLELMQRALLRGASTAEAARYALAHMPKASNEPSPPVTELRLETTDGEVVLGAGRDSTDPAGPPRFARQLSAASLAMDVRAVQHLLAEAIGTLGVLDAWEGVIRPVVAALGAGWRDGRGGSEVGYLLTECVFGALVRATPVLAEPRNLRPVLLGSVPDERDTLPLYVLAAALAERRIVTQLFGVPLPADVLAVAVRRSSPAAVVLWAQRGPSANPRLFTRIARGRQRGRLFACGPAWHAGDLPPKVELLGDIRDAAERVEYVLLGDAPRG